MRYTFGGGASDFAILAPSGQGLFVKAAANQSGGTAWSAESGGTQYTDLIAVETGPPIRTDGDGFINQFQGPDGVTNLWVDFGAGRFHLRTTDTLPFMSYETTQTLTDDQEIIAQNNLGLLPGRELAHAENNSTSTVAIPITTPDFVPGCMIVVPPTIGPIEVQFGGAASVSTTGGGAIGLQLWDVTAGGAGTKLTERYIGNVSTQAVLFSGSLQGMDWRRRLDGLATERILALKSVIFRDTSSALVASLNNNASGLATPTYITAVQR